MRVWVKHAAGVWVGYGAETLSDARAARRRTNRFKSVWRIERHIVYICVVKGETTDT